MIAYNHSAGHKSTFGHHECPERIDVAVKRLKDLYPDSVFIHPDDAFDRDAALDLVRAVHSSEYIDRIFNQIPSKIRCKNCKTDINTTATSFPTFLSDCSTCPSCSTVLNKDNIICYQAPDTYFTPETVGVVLQGITALKQLLDNIKGDRCRHGYALIRPPGHHCANKAEGFCIVNNVAIAAKYAQSLGYARVCIFDIDFHHGNGTAALVKDMPGISLVSIHGYDGLLVYPGTGSKAESTENVLNIPIEVTIDPASRAHVTDAFYKDLVETEVLPFIHRMRPDMIIVSNGFDGHRDDPLEGFNLTDEAYVDVVRALKTVGIPLLFVTEGGYSVDTIARVSEKMCAELEGEK